MPPFRMTGIQQEWPQTVAAIEQLVNVDTRSLVDVDVDRVLATAIARLHERLVAVEQRLDAVATVIDEARSQ